VRGAKAAWLVVPATNALTVYRTISAGVQWHSASLTLDADGGEPLVMGVDFVDIHHGWLAVNLGGVAAGSMDIEVYATTDGGATWHLKSGAAIYADGHGRTPLGGLKTGFAFATTLHGWITGLSYANAVWLYASRDAGKSWHSRGLPAPAGSQLASMLTYLPTTLPPWFVTHYKGFLPVYGSTSTTHIAVFYATVNGGSICKPTMPFKTGSFGPRFWGWPDARRSRRDSADPHGATRRTHLADAAVLAIHEQPGHAVPALHAGDVGDPLRCGLRPRRENALEAGELRPPSAGHVRHSRRTCGTIRHMGTAQLETSGKALTADRACLGHLPDSGTLSSDQPADGAARDAVFVSTSWDDGHVLDHKLANLLEIYALRGTFYVATQNVEIHPRDRLGSPGIRSLAERFEIGAHTRRHLRLPTLSLADARDEIIDGKAELEDMISREVRSFCYPGGSYLGEHVSLVRDAGFSVARTVRRYSTVASPLLEMPTTVHALRHFEDWPDVLRIYEHRLGLAHRALWNWDLLAVELFDQVLHTGGVFHLWGHSWEVDARGDWSRLERVFAHISRRPGISYVGNGELPNAVKGSAGRMS
jgi:peptidoglycan/xylan/chitin deacetylase (PgdA/CDA1 family)